MRQSATPVSVARQLDQQNRQARSLARAAAHIPHRRRMTVEVSSRFDADRPVARLPSAGGDAATAVTVGVARPRSAYSSRIRRPSHHSRRFERRHRATRRAVTTYVDSSALVPIYVPERFSAPARSAIRAAGQIPFTAIHDLEVTNAFELLVGRHLMTREEARSVQRQLRDDVESRRLMLISLDLDEVFTQARELSKLHAAKHLARGLRSAPRRGSTHREVHDIRISRRSSACRCQGQWSRDGGRQAAPVATEALTGIRADGPHSAGTTMTRTNAAVSGVTVVIGLVALAVALPRAQAGAPAKPAAGARQGGAPDQGGRGGAATPTRRRRSSSSNVQAVTARTWPAAARPACSMSSGSHRRPTSESRTRFAMASRTPPWCRSRA